MDFKEFKILSESYNVIPVTKTLLADTQTPVSAYLHLRRGASSSFLFESVEGGERFARYSFIGRDPVLMLKCKGKTTEVFEHGTSRSSDENFFDILQDTIRRFKHPPLPDLPRFTGGLVGYIGYDAIRFIEEIPQNAKTNVPFHDSVLGLFSSILVFDHLKHQITIINNVIINPERDLRAQHEQAMKGIGHLEKLLWSLNGSPHEFSSGFPTLEAELSKKEFQSLVVKAKEYIRSGDIFQVVLSQRFSTDYEGDTFNVYRALRVVNPSPYLYYLDFDGDRIIGSSPEILVRVEEGVAEVYPIAGTRPRGKNDEEDKRLEAELLADQKECAEHVMLVDLGRNDLGRVCEMGTVHVDQMMSVVRYSHVMHIASRVAGKVAAGKTCIDVLKAAFPAGTVSGAPKIRAMEIIDELEHSRRGIYAGGVGYFDFSGNMDLCIAIRTLFASEDRIYFQAGAGIVADSVPENEYQETLNKSKALLEALKIAEGVMH